MQKAEHMEQLLDQVHAAIVAGDLLLVRAMAGEIDSLLADLPRLADQGLADRLRAKAERNAACLQAAARGVRAARRRIAEIRAAQDGLATYDGKGKRQELPQGNGTLAQRL